MNFVGVVIGAAVFLIIGLFHPLVIVTEYHFGKRIWPVYLVVGLATTAASLFIANVYLSATVGAFGFASLWTIKEMFEQEERVAEGRFPAHPTGSHHAAIREKLKAGEKTGAAE